MTNARNLANLLGTKTKVKDVDVDGTELILDADADTSITADTDDQIDFKTGGSDRVTIDSSGNLLVAKTSNDSGTAVGAILGNAGVSRFTADGAHPVVIKRKSDNGTIVQIEKDSTIVGAIGVSGTRMHLLNGDTGLRFAGDTNSIFPCTTAGADSDNAIDFGASGNRFKDFYLGGGIYLGGTGSANHLDDYEEGTWTPTFVLGSTACTVTSEGTYTKVGRVVTINMFISITNTNSGSGTAKVQSLPFAVADLLQFTSVEANGSVSLWSSFATAMSFVSIFAQTSQQAELQGLTSGTQQSTTTLNQSHFDNACEFRGSVTYFTT